MAKKLIFETTAINGVFFVTPQLVQDNRGIFFRTFCRSEFSEIGFKKHFVQMNQSINHKKGTLRGLHFQSPAAPEEKLIRCSRGSIFDVILDLRKESPTFLKYVSATLSEDNKQMILVPAGCAHGFLTLENDCDLIYCHTHEYTPSEEMGVRYDDPRFSIDWPDAVYEISERDASHKYVSSNFLGYEYEM